MTSDIETDTLNLTKAPSCRRSDGGSQMWSSAPCAQRFDAIRVGKADNTYITSIIYDIESALLTFDATVVYEKVESWAVFIIESLSSNNRTYHGIDHVLNLSRGVDAIQLFAAFFHDTIMYNLDGGLTPAQRKILDDVVVHENNGKTFIRKSVDKKTDPLLAMAMEIFDLKPGQLINTSSHELFSTASPGCMDEFLSAVAATRLLGDTLSVTTLTQIVACIEATQPFRRNDKDGLSSMDHLYRKLCVTNKAFCLGMTEGDLVTSAQRAADMSNRNCGNFATALPVDFLDETWKLLPEQYPALRRNYLYTVYDYHRAMSDMLAFFQNLDPSVVFTSFSGLPSEEEVADFNMRCARNVELAKTYLQTKLLFSAVISAFAELTGGNVPMAYFIGDLPQGDHVSDRLEDEFSTFKGPTDSKFCNLAVYKVLVQGRKSSSLFDPAESPTTAFIYGKVGDKGLRKAVTFADWPMTREKAASLLSCLPASVVYPIGKGIARLAVPRVELLSDVLTALKEHNLENISSQQPEKGSKVVDNGRTKITFAAKITKIAKMGNPKIKGSGKVVDNGKTKNTFAAKITKIAKMCKRKIKGS